MPVERREKKEVARMPLGRRGSRSNKRELSGLYKPFLCDRKASWDAEISA